MPEDADIREPVDLQDPNATIDRMMVRHALAQLSAEHRAVVWRSYYLGWTLAQDGREPDGG
jgi:RNA polymerase sigma-70 factor (ECF subfamily)